MIQFAITEGCLSIVHLEVKLMVLQPLPGLHVHAKIWLDLEFWLYDVKLETPGSQEGLDKC